MSNDIVYDANDFDWVKRDNCFYADEDTLYTLCRKYRYPFPNGRKQFFIKNLRTGGFRRFRFVGEFQRVDWHLNDDDIDDVLLEFSSEDNILCRIFIGNYDD